MYITKHAKSRIRQRQGTSKASSDKMAQRAYYEGITHKQAKGKLKQWMTKEYNIAQQANQCRYYANKLYIFHNSTLISVLNSYTVNDKNLQYYVYEYKYYVRYKINRLRYKKSDEDRNEFLLKLSERVKREVSLYITKLTMKSDLSEENYAFHDVSHNFVVNIYFFEKALRDEELEEQLKKYVKQKYDLSVQFLRYQIEGRV